MGAEVTEMFTSLIRRGQVWRVGESFSHTAQANNRRKLALLNPTFKFLGTTIAPKPNQK